MPNDAPDTGLLSEPERNLLVSINAAALNAKAEVFDLRVSLADTQARIDAAQKRIEAAQNQFSAALATMGASRGISRPTVTPDLTHVGPAE